MASKGGGTAAAAGVVRVSEMEKMSLEQLKALKEQADMEVNMLQDSLNNIRTATSRLDIASNALQDLSLRKKMLVPLTASLYVPGTLDDSDKVLVDVGFEAETEVVKSAKQHLVKSWNVSGLGFIDPKLISEFLGLSCEGFEAENEVLFTVIKIRWKSSIFSGFRRDEKSKCEDFQVVKSAKQHLLKSWNVSGLGFIDPKLISRL
ncbi:hypothetical protein HHK36_006551 [Tetracentron sinense]|uniref:Uncharacterized protein n=1 Tax=Tetracentron sinense TaxID=13715 RepID=A0A834ZHE0_TETSI|nr:hypothetical protein HHK36_006551 [Tetracentron sinense]